MQVQDTSATSVVQCLTKFFPNSVIIPVLAPEKYHFDHRYFFKKKSSLLTRHNIFTHVIE